LLKQKISTGFSDDDVRFFELTLKRPMRWTSSLIMQNMID
jgi:hypothetical protein